MLAAEGGQRERADDVDLGAELLGGRVERPLRRVHRGHRVLDRHPLLSAPGAVLLAAAERGEDQRGAAVDDVRAVELGRDVDGELGLAHRLLGDVGVGDRGDEVAAHREEHLGPAVLQGLDGVDGVEAVLARRLEAELVAQRVEERRLGPLPDAHGPVALHVGVAADRAEAGSGLADVALEERDVGDLLDRGHRVAVLGQPHRPADDRAGGVAKHRRALLDLLHGSGRSRRPPAPSRAPSRGRRTPRSRC